MIELGYSLRQFRYPELGSASPDPEYNLFPLVPTPRGSDPRPRILAILLGQIRWRLASTQVLVRQSVTSQSRRCLLYLSETVV